MANFFSNLIGQFRRPQQPATASPYSIFNKPQTRYSSLQPPTKRPASPFMAPQQPSQSTPDISGIPGLNFNPIPNITSVITKKPAYADPSGTIFDPSTGFPISPPSIPMTPYRPYPPPASTGQPQGEPLPPTTPPLPRTDQIAPPEAPFEKPAPTPTPEQPKAPAPLSKEEQAVADAEKAHELAMQISPDQLSTQEDLDKLIEATKKAYRNAQDQPIALEFITGQLSSLENRALGLAEPLEKKLARLQAQRTSALESSKFGL